MKTVKYIFSILIIGLFMLPSCNEEERLKEVPKDFYSPENAYITKDNFQSAINHLYYRVRHIHWGLSENCRYSYYHATDFAYCFEINAPGSGHLNDYKDLMLPTRSEVRELWDELYSLITDANIILTRIDADASQVLPGDRQAMKSETLFFRAFAYRMLANAWGGVPIVVEEVTVPRRDYVRATREEVYQQCVSDLLTAITVLPDVDKVTDGKTNKHAALHLLTEVYISLKQWDNAINAATQVINYSGNELMKERFGAFKNEEGDVYWDLFRQNNQNRQSGNKEALYVLQYDYNSAGSTSSTTAGPRCFIPFYETAALDGQTLFVGVTDRKGGRGIGWARPTNLFVHEIWAKDGTADIRNSPYNIVRDLRVDNPRSPHFGKWIAADGLNQRIDTIRCFYPLMTKVCRVSDFPEDFYVSKNVSDTTAFGERRLLAAANSSYKDEYLFRLAETYLLHAEACVGKGDMAGALASINTVRARAKASPATLAEMSLDYVLEERLRELYTEELRIFTLLRLGKLYERVKKYNRWSGRTIEEYHNLWPIPYTEIERNTAAVLAQNPGYIN